jgi:hypothetical protein
LSRIVNDAGRDSGARPLQLVVFAATIPAMEEIVRTNDPVLISYIEALLKEAGVVHLVLDTHMSVLEGSLGMLPRRILVDSDQSSLARMRLREAGLGKELREQ